MAKHTHCFLFVMQQGRVQLWRCLCCRGERRGARAFMGRVIWGPVSWPRW